MSAVRPRVAVDLRALVPAPSGIGVYTRSLLLELAARGGVELVGMAHREPNHAEELRAAGIRVEHQAAPFGVFWQQWILPRRLAEGDVDLLWSPLNTLPVRSPVPGVVTIHDLTAILMPETHRTKVRWSVLPFIRPTLERAAAVVAISEATAADLRFHFPQTAGKLHVVHNGIDSDFVPGDEASIEATREEMGAPAGYLLYAGTLEPRKGVDTLLEAWQVARREDAATPPLVLAGPYGWHSDHLLRDIERLAAQGVRYLGRVERPHLVRLMQAARLFVYPSRYEGFGLPPAESLACGVPVIASQSSSQPEVVGDAGVLVEPGDPAALAGAIRHVLGEPELEAELRARALPQASRFTWPRAAAEMERIFLAARNERSA
jgi:glycosyltransferase involved in cell wall biosynthesis